VVTGVIELPDEPAPNGVSVTPLDYGFVQRGPAASLRIDRPGSRFRVEVSFPPMKPDVARRFMARLQKARREGLRIEYPLLGVNQGAPGSPVVNGTNPTGTTLPLRGLTPHYAVKEGFWLHVEDADGVRYLHNVTTNGIADASGLLSVEIEPAIRAPLADGSAVELAKPTFEGFLGDDLGWSLDLDRLVRGGSIMIEEAA
jgi:hypothetical protein